MRKVANAEGEVVEHRPIVNLHFDDNGSTTNSLPLPVRHSRPFTDAVWFLTLLGLLASLGAQVLIGAALPLTSLDWLDADSQQSSIVLVAGVTSFWAEDTLIRAASFGLGACCAFLIAHSPTWRLGDF